MISNQIKVLIQRMRLCGFEPWKILLHQGLRWALKEEMKGNPAYRATDQGDFFGGLMIVIDNTVTEPLILAKPERKDAKFEEADNFVSN